MAKRLFLLPYTSGSNSVKNLLQSVENLKGIRTNNSKYKSKTGDVVINWGCTEPHVDLSKAVVLNKPENLRVCTNKRNFFELMTNQGQDNPRVPMWTTQKAEAEQWIEEGKCVFARTKLAGHSGEGIIELTTKEELAKIKEGTLLVLYVPKKEEYRIHFFKGELIDFQRKARMRDREDPNWRIRSHANGFVYSRNDIELEKDVVTQAEKCVKVLSPIIDFGAIDIIYNKWKDQAFVLEVNTAPGLEGTTLTNYVNTINKHYGG